MRPPEPLAELNRRCERCGNPGTQRHHEHADERVAVLDTAQATDYKCMFCPQAIRHGEEHWRFQWSGGGRAHKGCSEDIYYPEVVHV